MSNVIISANEIERNKGVADVVESLQDPVLFYAASCPYYSKHQMKPRGYVVVINEDTHDKIWGGQLFVCDCGHIVAIKNGHAHGWKYIGEYYRSWVSEYEAGHIVIPTALFVNPSDIEYTNKNYLEGYEFLN